MLPMSEKPSEKAKEKCAAEIELASEFPELFAFYSAHPVSRPEHPEQWERSLRVARNCCPILEDLRARGLDLVRVDHYTPPGTDRRPLYQTVIDWLPRIQDPLALSICLDRLGEPGARALVKKNRELLLSLARKWNDRLREEDREHTLAAFSYCVVGAARESDLPEILDWVRDGRLPSDVRAAYIFDLKRFARKPGIARDAIVALVNDREVGRAAVWSLAEAMKAEALPLMREIRDSSPHDSVRQVATAIVKKIEARLRRVDLADASPAMLPQGYASTSIEFNTEYVPKLLSALERELKGQLKPEVGQQLALSADQIKRGRRRFHIVDLLLPGGVASQVGFGLYAEDEDVIVVEIHFDARFRDSVDAALNGFLAEQSEKDG